MNAAVDAFLRSWPFDPWLYVALLTTAAVYLRGYVILRRRAPRRWPGGPVLAFLGGLLALFLALASPVEPFASLLLQVHMLQHLLLMMVAPPLLWLGQPLLPLVRGLPEPVRTYWVVPLFQSAGVRRFLGRCTHPAAALPLYVAATWLWHVPRVYDLALRSAGLHYLQHACFLLAALAFWYPVVRPYPSRPRWSEWLLLPYLLVADVQNTILSALLTFSDRVLYPYYAEMPRLGGLSALDDQSAAGVLMWVPGSLVFLLPLFAIGVRLLSGDTETKRQAVTRRVALPVLGESARAVSSPRFDLLRVPLLGRLLGWRHARLAFQVPLLAAAMAVIWDGLRGPQAGPLNLAGVLPWIHWRGLVVVGLLAAGNLFCLGCPFLLPRTLARRLLPRGRAWPRRLRSKWSAAVLLGLFLWAYEAFALWDSPWWTAWIAVGYFGLALVVDGLFRDAAFCKYLCPIGQFNFVQSLVSPLEVAVRDPAVCSACRTKDCIRGRDGIPGCELHLYQPRKAGNMDCTFCLDCVHACPHDNVGMLAGMPGRDLWREPPRSGVGAFGQRLDLAVLVILLVFGAFTNAAGMIGPVVDGQTRLQAALGWTSSLPLTTAYYLLGLVILPASAVVATAMLSRSWGHLRTSPLKAATRFAFALVPLGFSMWLAHYGFHFITSYDAVVPALQRFAADLGIMELGSSSSVCACCQPVADWLPRLEIVCLDCGLLLSLYAAYRIALTHAGSLGQSLKAFTPWAVLLVLLFAAGVWIVLQPMQMRGMSAG
jgi:cytochrome c oxidase assembly factor CtaG